MHGSIAPNSNHRCLPKQGKHVCGKLLLLCGYVWSREIHTLKLYGIFIQTLKFSTPMKINMVLYMATKVNLE